MANTTENSIRIFENEAFGQVRTVVKDGEPWFCLADVCRVLELSNSRMVKERLSQKGVSTTYILTNGGEQATTFITESNLYKVIFQSRKPEAEKFSEWVTEEVLPSIRKHGMYAEDELLQNPDLLLKVVTQLKQEHDERLALEKKTQALEQKVAEDEPKVLFADAVSTSNTCILIGELAKLLKGNGIDIGQNRLFTWLREHGFLIARKGTDYNAPTQRAMNMGLFKVKETAVTHTDGSVTITKTTKVTGKGQQYFIRRFLNEEE